MVRSFTDRVFGGVCGGLAVPLRLNPWWIRLAFVLLTPVTLGAALLVYLALWWVMPMESLLMEQRGGLLRLLLVLVIILGTGLILVGGQTGWLAGPSDQTLILPALLLLFGSVFLLVQLRT
ncbi:MAG: PspC domain-containing protein [Chloroflexota bacterium]